MPVNIAVLDAGAHLKAFGRMDGAVLGSIDVARRKATTAVLFHARSEAVWDYCKPGAPAPGLELSNGGLAPFGGGIPLQPSGRHGLIGAVGVSGGSVAQDVEIAEAAPSPLTTPNPRLRHQEGQYHEQDHSHHRRGLRLRRGRRHRHGPERPQRHRHGADLAAGRRRCARRRKALGLTDLRVEKLDLLDPYDMA